VARRVSHATQGKTSPNAALLAMTGVLPNGSLPSLVRKKTALTCVTEVWRPLLPLGPNRIWKSGESYLKLAANLSTSTRHSLSAALSNGVAASHCK
jgi:hypothetical protein